jgi:hypothetical protein
MGALAALPSLFHAVAGAKRCRGALAIEQSPGDGRACARLRPRTALLASPLSRHSGAVFDLSWVRPGAPIYSRNRQNQSSLVCLCLDFLRRLLRNGHFGSMPLPLASRHACVFACRAPCVAQARAVPLELDAEWRILRTEMRRR